MRLQQRDRFLQGTAYPHGPGLLKLGSFWWGGGGGFLDGVVIAKMSDMNRQKETFGTNTPFSSAYDSNPRGLEKIFGLIFIFGLFMSDFLQCKFYCLLAGNLGGKGEGAPSGPGRAIQCKSKDWSNA